MYHQIIDHPKKKGYIAITAAIFLSLIILLVAVSIGSRSLFSRSINLQFYFKKISFFTARTCLEVARFKLASDSNYAGNETITIDEGGNQCTIGAITSSPPNKIIKSRSQVSGATTNLKLTVNSSTLATVFLEETVQ